MTRFHLFALTTAVMLLVCTIAAVLVVAHKHVQPATTSPASPAPGRAPARVSASAVSDGALLASIRAFALAYGDYLNGGADMLTGKAGLTAAAQATQEGQIPVAFRDGHVRMVEVESLQSTCCSASVTVVLANREERYPFAEQLLLERHGWVVDQVTPPDLSMDRNLRPTPHVTMPAGGTAAAKAFAVGYVNFRSGESLTRPAMTAAAGRQIVAGTDSLAGQTLPKAPARLGSIKFGPPSGDEFAATATLRAGRAQLTFSFLMIHTPVGWECGQYL